MTPLRPAPRPAALGVSNVEQHEASVVTAPGVLIVNAEACALLLRLVDRGLDAMARANGMRPSLAPGYAAVVAGVKAVAADFVTDGPTLTAVVASPSAAPQRNSMRNSSRNSRRNRSWSRRGAVRVSSSEAAARWSVTTRHVRGLAAAAELPAVKTDDGHWTLDREFVEQHLTVEAARAAHRSHTETEDIAA